MKLIHALRNLIIKNCCLILFVTLHLHCTLTMDTASIWPREEAAMQVKFALSCILFNCSTFRPIGMSFSGVRSCAPDSEKRRNVSVKKKLVQFLDLPFVHLTAGIGDPTAIQDRFKLEPNITSLMASGGREKVGGTRRTFTYKLVAFECSVPMEFSATHSYFPWSSSRLLFICRMPEKGQYYRIN